MVAATAAGYDSSLAFVSRLISSSRANSFLSYSARISPHRASASSFDLPRSRTKGVSSSLSKAEAEKAAGAMAALPAAGDIKLTDKSAVDAAAAAYEALSDTENRNNFQI